MNYFILFTLISSVQTQPKLCINCKYFLRENFNSKFSKCSFFLKKEGKINFLVNGIINKDEYFFCSTVRDTDNMCGEEGKFYKEKDSK